MFLRPARRTINCFTLVLLVNLFISITSVNFASINFAFAGKNHLTKNIGDILQITNPLIAAYTSSQEKGLGHFAIIYGQSMGIMFATKTVGKKQKWEIGQRPDSNRFDGFPSGHTTSAWSSASYVRTFSNDYKSLSIPLYIAAGFTGYSRVESKAHTTFQVVGAIVLSELVTIINSKMNWSKNWGAIDLSMRKNQFASSLKIHF